MRGCARREKGVGLGTGARQSALQRSPFAGFVAWERDGNYAEAPPPPHPPLPSRALVLRFRPHHFPPKGRPPPLCPSHWARAARRRGSARVSHVP